MEEIKIDPNAVIAHLSDLGAAKDREIAALRAYIDLLTKEREKDAS